MRSQTYRLLMVTSRLSLFPSLKLTFARGDKQDDDTFLLLSVAYQRVSVTPLK